MTQVIITIDAARRFLREFSNIGLSHSAIVTRFASRFHCSEMTAEYWIAQASVRDELPTVSEEPPARRDDDELSPFAAVIAAEVIAESLSASDPTPDPTPDTGGGFDGGGGGDFGGGGASGDW